MRAAGIPAKAVVGYGFIPLYTARAGEIEGSLNLELLGHAWAIIYLPNIGWVPVDAVWPEKIGSLAEADYRHIVGAVTSGENVVKDGTIVWPGPGSFSCSWYGFTTVEGSFTGTIMPEVFAEPQLQVSFREKEAFTLTLTVKNWGRETLSNLNCSILANTEYFEIVPSVQHVNELLVGGRVEKDFEVRARITVSDEQVFIAKVVFDSTYGTFLAKGTLILLTARMEIVVGPPWRGTAFYEEWSSFIVTVDILPLTIGKDSVVNMVFDEKGFIIKNTPQTTTTGTAYFEVSIGDILPNIRGVKKDVGFRVTAITRLGEIEDYGYVKVLNYAQLKDVWFLGWMITPLYHIAIEFCLASASLPHVKSEVRKFIKQEWGDITDPYELVQRINVWVTGAIKYNSSSIVGAPDPFCKLWDRVQQNYGNVLGDCTDYTILFVGMCRAIDIPARVVSCFLGAEDSFKGFQVGHDFAEVFIQERWVHTDPTPTWERFNYPEVYEEEYGMLFALASGLVDRTSYYHGFRPKPKEIWP